MLEVALIMAVARAQMPNSEILSDQGAYREIMQKGSKTFSLAARLFDHDRRFSAMLLYAWCRHCDDAIDAAPDQNAALEALDSIKTQTLHALDFSTPAPNDLPMRALREICQLHSIPVVYPLELLNGMEMDTAGVRIRCEADLKLYCYRVASVVGLMMSHVMGVANPKALRHAVDTGLAMQMTNIARDIEDDFNMKRIYIPDSWFVEIGLERPDVEGGARFIPQAFTEVVKRLVALADTYYASGRSGIRYLPWRAAFAVASAQRIYREIGIRVVKKRDQAWFSRTYVPLARKLVLMSLAIGDVVMIKLRHRKDGSYNESPTAHDAATRKLAQANQGNSVGLSKTAGQFELSEHVFRSTDL